MNYLLAVALILLVQAGIAGRTGTNNPATPAPPPPSGNPACTVGVCSLGGTCTGAGSCAGGTCSGLTAATTLSTVGGLINGASAGDVVCLARAETWSGSNGISLTKLYPSNNRVTICASSGANCSDSGAVNPKLSITGTTEVEHGIQFKNGSGGYEVRNLDMVGADYSHASTTNLEQTTAYEIQRGTSHIRVVGGTYQLFYNLDWSDVPLGVGFIAPPDDIEIGTCASPVTWSGAPANQAVTNHDHHAVLGTFTNAAFRINDQGWSVPLNGSRSHFIDITNNDGVWTGSTAAHNVTVECSTFANSTGSGTVLKFADGTNGTIQNNTWAGCQAAAIGFESHGQDHSRSWGWDTAVVHHNRFDFTGCTNSAPVSIGVGSNIRVYDNIARLGDGDFQGGFVRMTCNTGAAQAEDNPVAHIHVYSNTVFRTGNPSGVGNQNGVIQRSNGSCVSGVTGPTDLEAVNNLIIEDTSVYSIPWTKGGSACNDWGTNASQFHDNFECAPNKVPDLSLGTGACSGDDDFVRSGTDPTVTGDGFTTKPGLLGDAGNWAGPITTDFQLTNASAKVYKHGFGNAGDALCPATDYAGNAQTSPCTIGAFSNIP